MSRPKHTNQGEFCPACEEKLALAHPEARSFFHFLIVNGYRDAHISRSFSGPEEQNSYVKSGKSEKPWPSSKHNFMIDGVPNALALDLFRLLQDGQADFPSEYYFAIFLLLKSRPEFSIRWGGDFRQEWLPDETYAALRVKQKAHDEKTGKKSLIDGPHFEVKGIA